jgi:lipopolysaccharide export system protein LptA
MKQLLVFFAFGVPATLALLALGGDLFSPDVMELEQIPAEKEDEPPEIPEWSDSPVQQRLTNWEYRHFDPQQGVFDWFARGTEAIPRSKEGDEVQKYDVVEPEVLFSSFTSTTPLRKKTLTTLNAGAGKVEIDKEFVNAKLTGGVVVSNTDVYAEHGPSEISMDVEEINIRARNRRKGEDAVAAELWTDKVVHLVSESFEIFGMGGMRGSTELNRITLAPPIRMHLIVQEEGMFFGKKPEQSKGGRRVRVEGSGPLLLERQSEKGEFLMAMSGRVVVTDGDISVKSDTLGVTTGRSRKAEQAWAAGNVVALQGTEPRLFGEEIKWDSKAGRTVMKGRGGVRFVGEKNRLNAKTATLLEDRRTLLLEGGVEADFEHEISKTEKKQATVPHSWQVFCDNARVDLAKEGGSLTASSVALRPAAGDKVLITSADGSYRITAGLVTWEAGAGILRMQDGPELTRGKSEWASADEIILRLEKSELVFRRKVKARVSAQGAQWQFDAGLMTAKFEAPQDRNPSITSATLTAPGKQVIVDYTSPKGAAVRLASHRVSWDAASQTTVLESGEAGKLQKFTSGKDWMQARRVVFEPESLKAVFEGSVLAHFEEASDKSRRLDVGGVGGAEPPFEMSSEKLTIEFGENYEARKATAEGSVRFTGSSGGLALECERAVYERGGSIVFEDRKGPKLTSGKSVLTASRIEVFLAHGRILFSGKVMGGFKDKGGTALKFEGRQMTATYERASGALRQVYARGGVQMEAETEKEGKATAKAERAVYDVEKREVSLAGKPVVVNQPSLVIREEKIVYDLKEDRWYTKPGKKGYDWEVDPSGWKKEEKKR